MFIVLRITFFNAYCGSPFNSGESLFLLVLYASKNITRKVNCVRTVCFMFTFEFYSKNV